MPAQPVEQFLRIGDNIFLFDDDNRLLTSENPLQTRVLAKSTAGTDSFPREAVGCSIFRIEPQQNFVARKELLKSVSAISSSLADQANAVSDDDYNDQSSATGHQPEDLPSAWLNAMTSSATTQEELQELNLLQTLATKEQAQNEAERRRLHGKPVLYGQTIRLYNAHFRKYVSVNSTKSCELATGQLRVDLTREAGGYFRIMPRFKIRVEGEPIRLGDTVALQSVRPEGYLNIGTQPLHSEVYFANYYEVFTHTRMASWTIRLHSNTTLARRAIDGTTTKDDTGMLKAGQFVRMYHKELEGYVECHVGEITAHIRRHVLNPLDPKESNSPIAFWQIELEDPFKGSTVRWRKRCRIKHAASRAYLYIDTNNVTIRADTGTVGFHLGLTTSSSFLGSNDPTLFELAPVASSSTESDISSGFSFGSYARIQHVLTKCWLHASSEGFHAFSPKPTGATASAYSPTTSPRLERRHRFRDTEPHELQSPRTLGQSGQLRVRQDDIVAAVTASPELHYDDCFSLTQVQSSFVDTFNLINEMVPRLHWFLKKTRKVAPENVEVVEDVQKQGEEEIRSRFPIGEAEKESIAEILTALIKFCTKCSERDPLKRTGIPIEYHQTVLRDVGIIRLIIDILQVPFDLEKRASVRSSLATFSTKRTIRPPLRSTAISMDGEEVVSFADLAAGHEPRLQHILSLCHALLDAFMLSGGKHEHDKHQQQNQRHVLGLVGGSLDFFIAHLGCGVGAARTLMRLLVGNPTIMDTVVASRELVVGGLITFLDEHVSAALARKGEVMHADGVNDEEIAAVVDVLSGLCYISEFGPITENQDYIAGRLLKEGEASKILVHTRVAWERHSSVVTEGDGDANRVLLSGHNVTQLMMPQGLWLSLEKFVAEETKQATMVLESILGLLEALCLGKNLKSIELVRQSWIGQDVCLSSLMDVKLPMDLRAKFCDLLTVLYVDTPPFKRILFSDFTFPYEGLAPSTELPWEGVDGHDERTPPFFEDLRRWILQFLDDNARQLTEDIGTSLLMSSVLRLVHETIKLGFYKTFDELQRLLRALIQVLDGSTDARNVEHVKFLSQPDTDASLWRQRFALSEENLPVMEAKIQILEIMETLFNLRLRVRVHNLAVEWQQLENPKSGFAIQTNMALAQMLVTIFYETNLLDREDVLMPILKDLLKYQYAPLKRAAVVVLHRIYNDCEDIFAKAQKALLLSSAQQVLAYHGIKKRLAEFRLLNARGVVDPADVPMIIKHVNEFIQLCKDNVSIDIDDQIVTVHDRGLRDSHKRIFKNLGTQNVIVHLMKSLNNIKAEEDDDGNDTNFDWESKDDPIINAMAACMILLEQLCVDDKDLQDVFILEHLDILIAVTAYRPSLVASLILICSNNLHICVRVREHHLQRILELSESRHAKYLRLLHELVKASGKLVKRNQDIIVRLLVEHQGLYIVNGKDLSTPAKLEYYAEMIDLLAVCTEGENQIAQSFCRTILSVKSIAPAVLDPTTPHVLKRVLLRFIVSVYLWNTEATSSVILNDNPAVMSILENAHAELQSVRDTKQIKDAARKSYIFDGVIIFLRALFEFHITSETTAQGSFRTLCNEIVDDTVGLLPLTYGDQKTLRHLTGALDSMINIAGFTGSIDPPQLQEKLRIAQMKSSNIGQNFIKTGDGINIKFQGFLKTLKVHRDVLDLQMKEFKKLSSHFRLTDSHSKEDLKSLIDYLSVSATTSTQDHKTDNFETKTIKILEDIPGDIIRERAMYRLSDSKRYEMLEKQKDNVQNTLNELGCTLMAQTLLSSTNQSTFNAALKLLIALLEGGNRQVQDMLENYFLGIREERFFYCMHSRLQAGISSLQEAQQLLLRAAQKQERQNFIVTADSTTRTETPTSTTAPPLPVHRSIRSHKGSTNTSHESFRRGSTTQNREPTGQRSFHGTAMESVASYQKLSALMANETAEFGTANEDFEVMKDIMRLLQLMVEGHNSNLQSYLRLQPDNIKSFDIVKDVVEYLHSIVPIANIQNLRLIIQVLDTITETAQGCLDNQMTIFNNKIVNPINSILREPYSNCPSHLVAELKSKAIICLLSLLEGGLEGSDNIFKEMASTLDLTIVRNMTQIYEQNKHQLETPGVYQKLEGGFLYCMLVMTLFPAFDEEQQAMFQNDPAFEFFKKNTGKIEIVLDKGIEKQLSRVLFPLPEICKYLRPETKELFLWTVKRDSASSKIEDFVAKSENIIFEIQNQARIVENQYLSILASYSSLWWQAAYGVTLSLNLIILLCSTISVDHPWSLESTPECGSFDDALRILLGLFHFSLWGLSTAEFTLIQLPVLVNRSLSDKKSKTEGSNKDTANEENNKDTVDEQNEKNFFEIWWKSIYQFVINDEAMTASIIASVTEPKFLYHVGMLSMSFLGFFYPSFYAIHLLDYVFRDRILQGVIASVTMNVTSLSRTVLLGIVLVYIHSLIAFMFFRNDFDVSKGLYCDSVLQCFVTILSHGVRAGGGIGDILEPPTSQEPFGWRVVFEMSFFLIVVIFLLNVIFGIIFDTFGHLRDERQAILQDMKNACFICNIEASEFQRHTKKGFEGHIKEDHNIWQYFFFLLHLKLKDVTEYTSQESYVADCLSQVDYGFFPINRALCLNQVDGNDDERLERVEDMLQLMMERLRKLEGGMDKVIEANMSSFRSALLSPT